MNKTRKLTDIAKAYDMISEADRKRTVKISDIANYVDIAPEEIIELLEEATEEHTIPTHKACYWRGAVEMKRVA